MDKVKMQNAKLKIFLCVLALGVMGMKCDKSKNSESKSSESEADTLSTVDSLTAMIESKRKELKELDLIIKARKDSLAQRETELKARELAFDKAKKRIDLTLKENNAKLAKTYESMEPDKVVAVMDSLSDKTVLKLLLSMRERNSAKILEALPPERAARITESLMREKNE